MNLEQRLARSAATLDAAIDAQVRSGRRRRPRRGWRRVVSAAAAVVIVVAGLVGVMALRSSDGEPASSAVSVQPTDAAPSTAADPTGGSVLSTLVAADVQPLVWMPDAGWAVEAMTGFVPVSVQPSPGCPGCGVPRLVLVADGPGFSGTIFTAWSAEGNVDIDEFATPVTVGGTAGRATSSAEGTPAALNRMTLAWPLGDDPGALTAFVDARGLSNEQVLQIAQALTWETRVPVMPARPAGFRQIDAPAAGTVVETYERLSNGRSTLEIYATNSGVHGLVDWHSIGNVLAWDWESRAVDGVTVAYDAPAAGEQPILAATAAWIAGGWGYVVIGHAFDTGDDFLDAVAALRLADAASFAGATVDAELIGVPSVTTTTGWNGEVQIG